MGCANRIVSSLYQRGNRLFPKITLAEQDESHGSSAFYYNVSIHRGEGVVMIK